jgi:hypothetical protein
LIVRGASGQTANLQDWQSNAGSTLAYMDASGNFAAVSKSFLIDHPTKESKKLRYASLEGPENGVYIRGRIIGKNFITLPDYWMNLVNESSMTVDLTPVGHAQPKLFVKHANLARVILQSDCDIDCYYVIYGTRKDIPELEVETNGH